MTDRPPIGQRVRVRRNTGIPGVAGKAGTVIRHHVDGVAVSVLLDMGTAMTFSPIDLREVASEPASEVAT